MKQELKDDVEMIIPEKSIFQTHIPRTTKSGQYLILVLIAFILALFSAIFYAEYKTIPRDTSKTMENPSNQ